MSKKSLIVAGSEGLIGKVLVKRLKNEGYYIISVDPKINNFNLENTKKLRKIFDNYENNNRNIVGYINCAYPKDFYDHIMFFMESTLKIAEEFYRRNIFGSIVNMASIYGLLGPDDSVYDNTDMEMPHWYAAAKGAIIAHSRCLAVRYAKDGIRINTIAAGGIFDHQPDSFVEAYSKRVPMGRMATVDDIVNIILFLISDKSKYITGQCIAVDGGLSSW